MNNTNTMENTMTTGERFDAIEIDELMEAASRGNSRARAQAWAKVLNAKKTLKIVGRCMTGQEYATCYTKISNTIARLREIDKVCGKVTSY